MFPEEALKFARQATGLRWPMTSLRALDSLSAAQASRAQVVSGPHPLGGIQFRAIDTESRRTLAPGFIVSGANAAERKRYTADLLSEAWAVLAAELPQAAAANV